LFYFISFYFKLLQ